MGILNHDYNNDPQLLPLEGEVLSQYQILLRELTNLQKEISSVVVKEGSESTTQALLQRLRVLEMKISLVHTLFKSSVYSLFEDFLVREE